MREFDCAFDAGIQRHDFAVAQGPVFAAARAGTGRAHERAPQNDENIVADDEPRKLCKTIGGHGQENVTSDAKSRVIGDLFVSRTLRQSNWEKLAVKKRACLLYNTACAPSVLYI